MDPGETLLPPLPGSGATTAQERPRRAQTPVPEEAAAAVPAGASRQLDAATGPVGALPRRRDRRGVLVAVGAIVIVAMIGVAIGIAVTRRASRSASITADARAAGPPDVPPSPADAAPPPPPADAPPAPVDAAPVDAAPAPRDATRGGVNGPASPGLRPASANTEGDRRGSPEGGAGGAPHEQPADVHALRARSPTRRIPRTSRAALMYADALIMTGNTERGCGQLRTLERFSAAQKQALAAGCPTD